MADQAQEFQPGWLLADRYSIERQISSGGWCDVYLAKEPNLHHRSVAVKVLRAGRVSQDRRNDPWIKRQFFMEMEALSRINHPNVVDVFHRGETPGGSLYLVLPYINGVPLREVIGQHGMNLKHVAYIIRQIGSGLTAAHQKGIFHCDLKPDNIMLQDAGELNEMVKLIDFGVAKVADSQEARSMVSVEYAGRGTWQYFAPEQPDDSPLGEWTDLYGAALIAYEMITGRRPIVAPHLRDLKAAQRQGLIVKPKDLRLELPESAQTLLLKALEFDWRERCQHFSSADGSIACCAEQFSATLANTLEDRFYTHVFTQPVGESAAQDQQSQTPPKADEKTEQARPEEALEFGHILQVGLAQDEALSEEQAKLLDQSIRRTATFQRTHQSGELVNRHFDQDKGWALIFNRRFLDAVECALELARTLANHPNLPVRMGVNSGPLFFVKGEDDQAQPTPRGGGINVAAQAMLSGDAGTHSALANGSGLSATTRWMAPRTRRPGEYEAQPGTRLHLFNLCRDGFGNPQRPQRFRTSDTTGSALPEILPLNLWVYVQDRWEGKKLAGEQLVYKPGSIVGNVAPKEVTKPVNRQTLLAHLATVREQVTKLIDRAEEGRPREGNHLEEAAYELSQLVLPEGGLVSVIGKAAHPHFDPHNDETAEINWEMLEERFSVCPEGHRTAKMQAFCADHGHQMRQERHKLSLAYHVTRATHGMISESDVQPSIPGKYFLFVEGPQGDLCAPSYKFDQKADQRKLAAQEFCADHLKDLRRWIERAGYEIVPLGPNPMSGHLLQALSNPEVAGIYYFGHGVFNQSGEGCLKMFDRLLPASEIENEMRKTTAAVKLVFLNACVAALPMNAWNLESGPT